MLFESSHSEHECSSCCSECTGSTAFHCAHCPRFGTTDAPHFPNGYDYSRLAWTPVNEPEQSDTAHFAELLTDSDRKMLSEIHIAW